MKTYVAILRGINVGGKRILKMDALRQLFGDLGLRDTQSYIQSGNLLFRANEANPLVLVRMISEAIGAKFFDVPVLVISYDELSDVLTKNPFLNNHARDIDSLHVTFLSDLPSNDVVASLLSTEFFPDEFQLVGKVVYLYCPMSYSSSKLTNGYFEKKLKVTATTRNWKSVTELLSMASNLVALPE